MAERGQVDGFIIGAQKAGSTSLDRYLATHPEVLAARHEVPDLEDPDYGRSGTGGVRAWVSTHQSEPHRTVVLRRPNYLCNADVPARMKAEWPGVKLIAVLRDPVHRAVSAYFHYMRYGLIPVIDPEEGLRVLLHGLPAEGWPRAGEVLEFGRYGHGLIRWREHFSHEAILALDSAELRSSPNAALGRAARHLGIDDSVAAPQMRDGMPGSYGMRHVRARSRALPLLYSRSRDHRMSARWVLPRVYDRTERLLWPDRTPAPSMSPGLIATLRSFYQPDVELLRHILPVDQLPTWAEDYR